jgi:hypothetical protein
MVANTIQLDRLSRLSTEDLMKQALLTLVHDRDTDALKDKVQFHKTELAPYFEVLRDSSY